MKKFISAVAAALICSALLTGCGGPKIVGEYDNLAALAQSDVFELAEDTVAAEKSNIEKRYAKHDLIPLWTTFLKNPDLPALTLSQVLDYAAEVPIAQEYTNYTGAEAYIANIHHAALKDLKYIVITQDGPVQFDYNALNYEESIQNSNWHLCDYKVGSLDEKITVVPHVEEAHELSIAD